MPNWCSNLLTVTGPEDAVAEFVEAVKPDASVPEDDRSTSLSLERIAPTPAEFLSDEELTPERAAALEARYGARDAFSWRVQNWGTKWGPDAEPPGMVRVGDVHAARYLFDSAWASPLAAMVAASRQYPAVTVRVEWSESGCGGAGYVVIAAGTVVEHLEHEVPQVLVEVLVDRAGQPVAAINGYAPDGLTPVSGQTLGEVVLEVLRGAVRTGPDPIVLVTCWEDLTLPASVGGALEALPDVEVTSGETTAKVTLTHAALTQALVGDGVADAWYEALCETWSMCEMWLPDVLKERGPALAAAAPEQTLAVQIAVCYDLSPEAGRAVADAVLAAGVASGPATRLLGQMYPDLPPLEDLTTILAGALLDTAHLGTLTIDESRSDACAVIRQEEQ